MAFVATIFAPQKFHRCSEESDKLVFNVYLSDAVRWRSDQGTYNDIIDNSFFNKTTGASPLLLRNTLVIDHLRQSTMGTGRARC